MRCLLALFLIHTAVILFNLTSTNLVSGKLYSYLFKTFANQEDSVSDGCPDVCSTEENPLIPQAEV